MFKGIFMKTTPANTPLKVLFLPALYPHKRDSMFGLFVRKHALAVRNHCRVLVLHTHPSPEESKITFNTHKEGNLTEITVYFPHKNQGLANRTKNLLQWYKATKMGFRLMKKEWGLPDITHVHIITRIAIPALWLKIFHRIPFVVTEHWSRYLDANNLALGRISKIFTRRIIRASSNLGVVSARLGESMRRQGLCRHYSLTPNVVNTELFKPATKKINAPVKTMVHISCFEEKSKNMSGILKAVKNLSQQRQDFRLKMIGTGVDLQKSIEQAKELNIYNTFVEFEGLKEGRELSEILAQADFSLLVSHYETFGIVVYESLACGVPVLVSDVADFKKDISPQFGHVIKNNTPESITEGMNRMLSEHNTFNPEDMRKFVVSNFSEKYVGMKICQLYEQILGITNNTRTKSDA